MKVRGIACAVAVLGSLERVGVDGRRRCAEHQACRGRVVARPARRLSHRRLAPGSQERRAVQASSASTSTWRFAADRPTSRWPRSANRACTGIWQSRAIPGAQNDTTIVGWMHGDEPDNAQSLGEGKGYGPPIPPEKIVADYREAQGTRSRRRPVLLNLGQGVAWDGWYGRGVRTNHPEDYPEYVEGCDIVSFDIYPAVHDKPEVAGKLWYVARGVERLRELDRRAASRLELHRVHAHQQREDQADAGSRSRPRSGCRSSTARRG